MPICIGQKSSKYVWERNLRLVVQQDQYNVRLHLSDCLRYIFLNELVQALKVDGTVCLGDRTMN